MTEKVTYVPTVIQWTENGKVRQRLVNIEEGFSFNFEQSNNKKYLAQAYKNNGKKPLLTLSKEDAYAILGFSRMKDDSLEKKSGDREYFLDYQDLEAASQAEGSSQVNFLRDKMIMTSGYGAKIADAHFAIDDKGNKLENHFKIRHSDANKISVFYNPKK